MSVYFIGVDLGTSGIKAGVIDTNGKILAREYRNTEIYSSGPGRMEQDPDWYYHTTLKVIQNAVVKSRVHTADIAGLAIDGQMGGIIGVDSSFDSVTGLDMGLDIRSEKYNAVLHEEYRGHLTELTCGSPRNTPKMMLWAREYPDVYRRVHKFITLSGYTAGKITGLQGEDAFIDYTLLSFFGNEDAKELSWSMDLTRELGLDTGKLPRIVNPWDIIGTLTKDAASEAGLKAGLPVMAGAGDQPAGFLGAGFLSPGQLLDVSGSTTLLCASVGSFIPDTRHHAVMYMPSIIKGKYTAFTYVNGGGISLKWFRDEFAEGFSWDDLTALIEKVPPGAEGLQFIPYLGGRQCPYSAELRGAWIGLNWGHKKEHLFRAVLEGLAFDYALGLDYITDLFPDILLSAIDGTGGGAENPVWNRIKANILNLPYRSLGNYQFALRGCALITGYSLGIFSDLEQAAKSMNADNVCTVTDPSAETVEAYRPYYETFKKAFSEPLGKTMHELCSVNDAPRYPAE